MNNYVDYIEAARGIETPRKPMANLALKRQKKRQNINHMQFICNEALKMVMCNLNTMKLKNNPVPFICNRVLKNQLQDLRYNKDSNLIKIYKIQF